MFLERTSYWLFTVSEKTFNVGQDSDTSSIHDKRLWIPRINIFCLATYDLKQIFWVTPPCFLLHPRPSVISRSMSQIMPDSAEKVKMWTLKSSAKIRISEILNNYSKSINWPINQATNQLFKINQSIIRISYFWVPNFYTTWFVSRIWLDVDDFRLVKRSPNILYSINQLTDHSVSHKVSHKVSQHVSQSVSQ